jgi:hypothetical protein
MSAIGLRPYLRTLSSGLQGFDFRLQFGSMSTRSFVGLRRHLLIAEHGTVNTVG